MSNLTALSSVLKALFCSVLTPLWPCPDQCSGLTVELKTPHNCKPEQQMSLFALHRMVKRC